MVTSNQMQRCVRLLLAMILLTGGICGGLCFAQTPGDSAAHSCCHHGKNHCGHAAPSIDGHAAVAMVKVAPVVLTAPVMSRAFDMAAFEPAATQRFRQFSPPLRNSVLRL
jgi:hypothetical protein